MHASACARRLLGTLEFLLVLFRLDFLGVLGVLAVQYWLLFFLCDLCVLCGLKVLWKRASRS